MWDHLRTPPFQRRKGLALQSSWGQLSWMLPASFTQQLCGQYTGLLRVCHLISYFTVTLMRCSSHGGTCLLGPTERPQYHDDLECWGCKKGRAFLGPPPKPGRSPTGTERPLAFLASRDQGIKPDISSRFGLVESMASSRDRGPRYTWGPVSRACPETRL